MKTITSFKDIINIINNKLDVTNPQGYIIPFVRFANLPLVEIVKIINEQSYQYMYDDN